MIFPSGDENEPDHDPKAPIVNITPSAWSEWEQFISTTDELSTVSSLHWDLYKLISVAIISTSRVCPPALSDGLIEMQRKRSLRRLVKMITVNVASCKNVFSVKKTLVRLTRLAILFST